MIQSEDPREKPGAFSFPSSAWERAFAKLCFTRPIEGSQALLGNQGYFMNDRTTPAKLGYLMPAEWATHSATWVSWPHRQKTWPGCFGPIPAVWESLVRTIAAFEPVHVLAGEGPVLEQARAMVGRVPNVTLHDIPTNDAWTRDHGPTFLVGPPGTPPALVDWEFNAWGRKWAPFDDDNRVPEKVAALCGCRRFTPGIVLEGGSIDVNGCGSVLATESVLLNPNRNPSLSREEIEGYLADYCGTPNVLWLGGGMKGDDTDGHVDQLARFVGPSTVVAVWEDDANDVNYAAIRENFERLQTMRDQDGRPLEVIRLPTPDPIEYNGNRLPASYANFYIANGLVVVPQFSDPSDALACRIVGRFFPDRQIIGLPARDLIVGRGAFHCATQQEPAWGK